MTLRARIALLPAVTTAAVLLLAACGGPALTLAAPRPETLAAVADRAPHPCNATTAAALDAIGVTPADVTRIVYDRRTSGSDREHTLGFDAYVRTAGGGLVIRHEPDCRLAGWFRRAA
jgi:hypothetical protein